MSFGADTRLRVISGVVLGAAVLLVTWMGGLPFRLLGAAAAALIFHEWTAMTRRPGDGSHQILAAAVLALVIVMSLLGISARLVLGTLGVGILAVAVHALLVRRTAWTTAGLAYAGAPAVAIILLRGADAPGLAAILYLFAVVWATDILAYFVGRAVGGRKLAPAISPGKTWSGAAGGTVAGVVAGILAAAALGSADLALLGGVAALLSIASQVGDLFESWVKRRMGVKDSGRLIPGHGGVMDRVDGLIAAGFVLFAIGAAAAGADWPAHGLFAPDLGAAATVTDSPALAEHLPASPTGA